ncbi:zinc ribbon domain-containing protein [Corynebacterium bovis]|uniref:zinc ribbon domain-containing protein n=1 Tax=Corynebacterium bovis TaxID=36808 RepID=UPI003139056E
MHAVCVPAAYASQRCHQCGHTVPENRDSQAGFRCVSCGHTANADSTRRETSVSRFCPRAPGVRTSLPVAATY